VGRDNVIAGGDCGFSSQAMYNTEVHVTVVWEKFKAMREGADSASKKLWAKKTKKTKKRSVPRHRAPARRRRK
jgi:hypothetical protein